MISIFRFDILPIIKVKAKVIHISIMNNSEMVTNRANITMTIEENMKWHMGFRITHLDLTGAIS